MCYNMSDSPATRARIVRSSILRKFRVSSSAFHSRFGQNPVESNVMDRLNRLFGIGQRAGGQSGSHPGGAQNDTSRRTDQHQKPGAQGASLDSPARITSPSSVPSPVPLGLRAENVRIVNKKRTLDKLDRIAFHPVHSLIALSDRSGRVQVYDYTSDTIAYSNQFGGVDEGGMQEIVLQRRAERYVGCCPPSRNIVGGGK